ncbi:protein qua-1 [Octopus bimaculoides]|uniref:Phospholipase A2 domain-containing protein n=1 Tax=Octopus bimaculoides TaxID=37653 RepID=A0A0L8HRW2_OCTBM|nr:protein qua-1 [Octopus bimaculoides]
MEGNVRVPRRLKRYFSSMCLVSVFLMVLVGPGAIITVLGQTMSFFNLTNLLGSFGSLIESLAGFGKGGSCTFKCPDGSKPRPNPVHASTTDGCGAFGFQIHSQLFPAVTTCCETHDFCYDMCNSNKSVCDSQFQDCLKMICKNIHKATGGTELYEGCISIAALAYKTTVAVGCKTFQQSQSNACICGGGPPHDDVHGDSSGEGGGGSSSGEGGGDSSSGEGGGGGGSSGEGSGGVGGGGGGGSSSSQFHHTSKKTFGTKSRPSGDSAPPGSESSDETFKQASSSSQSPPDQKDNSNNGDFGSKTAKGGMGNTRHENDMKGHKVYNHADIVRANMPPGSPSSPSSSSQNGHSTRDNVAGSKDDVKQNRRDKTKGSKNNLRRGKDDDDNDDDDDDDDDDNKYRSNVGGKKGYGKKHNKPKGTRQRDEF